MLDNLAGPNHSGIMERMRNRSNRAGGEPEAPTPEPETIDIKPDASEVEEVEVVAEETEIVESDEIAEEAEETVEEEIEELLYDLGEGREATLEQILSWEKGSMMQSDYTRKTQALAEDRKGIDAQKAELSELSAKLNEDIALLEGLIKEYDQDEVDGMSLEELREYDPGQYLKITESKSKKQKILEDIRSRKSSLSDSEKKEKILKAQAKMLERNPEWGEVGKTTEKFTQDMKLLQEYLLGEGYTPEEQGEIISSKHWSAIMDAARFKAAKNQSAAVKKKVRKAPVITKPKGNVNNAQKDIDAARAKLKRTGRPEDALALRKLIKKFNKGN